MLKKFLISTLIVLISIYISTISYAKSVEITKEDLKKSFNNLTKSKLYEPYGYKITVEDDNIKINKDGKDYDLKYDLKENPTFTFKIPIKKGMEYKEFDEQTFNILLPNFGYIAVANALGAKIEDAESYWMSSYFSNDEFGKKYSYSSYDDTGLEGIEVSIDKDDLETIYVPDFPDRAMEYVNYIYKDKGTMSDSKDANSYTLTIERQNVTETSCDLVCTLSVNLDADFSKLKEYDFNIAIEYSGKIGWTADLNGNVTKNEDNKNTTVNNDNKNNTNKNNTNKNNTNKLPQAGDFNDLVGVLQLIIILSVISMVFIKIYTNKIKNN